jgi:glycosyltransferase involved in cell wall biosynthesis
MHRICGSLAQNGYEVILVGRKLQNSKPLEHKDFHQKRLRCFYNKGFLFYAEYNIRLFFFLFTNKADAICAVDLDTIIPCLLVSGLKSVYRIYDAHEYFTELKEVRTRPAVKKIWKWVEGFCVPRFEFGYTVSDGLRNEFTERYNRNYSVIRNMPLLIPSNDDLPNEKYLFYGGAVNEARGFEVLIPAMKQIPFKLIVAGDGNFMSQLKNLIAENGVQDRVELKGLVSPKELRRYAMKATLGLGLAEKEGINQYMALPNKFFEYMHAGLPQIAMNFPEYRKINEEFGVGVLLNELSINDVVHRINQIMSNNALLQQMKAACQQAKKVYNWNQEEQKLLKFYQTILPR